MTTNDYLKLTFISLGIFFSLIPIGGYGGHDLKFLASTIIYFALTIYFLAKTKSTKDIVFVLLILILPPSLLYLPIHIKEFKETQISFISTFGHFFGIAFGIITHFVSLKVKIIFAAILLASSIWIVFIGYPLLLHKINFGTFSAKVYYDLPAPLIGQNQFGQKITDKSLKNKIILLDFWHTRCGVCFQKFPKLQTIYDEFKMDTSIVILAVNKPLKEDTIGQAYALLSEKGYNFPVLLPSIDSLPEMFNVQSYPTTILIDKSGKIIFRGDLDDVKYVITKLMKN